MKLVITIPAYNEEKTIGKVIDEIPKKIIGITNIKVLVIDDGSTDSTAKIAKAKGAKVIKNTGNKGLAQTFARGLNEAISMKADIIVNTDADFQYNQKQIPLLVAPVIRGDADIVLGSRFKGKIEEMPPQKYYGNKIATLVLAYVTGYNISDGQTGFRCFSRRAALKMNIWSNYTYTHETLLHASENKLLVSEVPIDFRKRADESRLISNIWGYALKSAKTLFNYYLYYRPLQLFGFFGTIIILVGLLLCSKVLLHFFSTGQVSPFFPTAILTSSMVVFGLLLVIMGLISETFKHQRRVTEKIFEELRK